MHILMNSLCLDHHYFETYNDVPTGIDRYQYLPLQQRETFVDATILRLDAS